MQVQMKTTMCGPSGTVAAGRVAEVSRKQAKDLIDGGYAVAVDGQARRPARAAKTEADQGGADADPGASS